MDPRRRAQSRKEIADRSHRARGGNSAPRGGSGDQGSTAPRSDSGPEESGTDPADLDELRRHSRRRSRWLSPKIHTGSSSWPPFTCLPRPGPNLPQSRLAIDALAALVEGLGERLGEVEAPLKEALAQIRLAYVQISGAADPGDERSA